MIYPYKGNYQYNILSIMANASAEMGVYYCCYMNGKNEPFTLYVGRARGDGLSIRSRILDHMRNDH